MRDGVEEVELAAPVAAGDDEPGPLEDREVLHHAEAGQLGQRAAQVDERLTVAGEEGVEQRAAVRVGQRPEDVVHAALHR